MMPTSAWAQTGSGIIAGGVRDATGAVLPGVTVEASSPALIEKVRSVVTDGEGQYKIVELRPGTYTVTFTLTGFNTVRREGIEITTGFTASVNAELKVGEVSVTIDVSGQSPVGDVHNSRQQVIVSREVADTVPTGKQYQNMAELIPGMVTGQGQTISQDVGGLSGQSFMSVAIHGGRQTDQRLEVSGMSVITWTRPDTTTLTLSDGNFEEYVIDTAAKSAESQTGGVRINMIPRQGGNTFNGALFANVAVVDWQADNLSDELKQKGLKDPNKLKSLWSINPTFGGPIKKDKLWFFAGFGYNRVDQYVAGLYLTKDPTVWGYVPDVAQQAVSDEYEHDETVHLTWQATPRNKITAYYAHGFSCHCHALVGSPVAGPARAPEASILAKIPTNLYQATWTSPFNSRLLFEAGAAYVVQNFSDRNQPESVAPRIVDTGINLSYRAGDVNFDAHVPLWTSRGSVNYVTGSHALKVGYNWVAGSYQNTSYLVGNTIFTALNDVPTQVEYRGTPVPTNNRVRPDLGIFAEDLWTLNRLTMKLGLRFDYFRADYPDQTVAPTQYVPTTRNFPGLEAVSWKDLNPRLGVAYDLFGNGKTALKASANRYVSGEGTGRASTINPIASNNSMIRRWTDNGDRIVQGDPFNPAENGELGASNNLNFGKPVISFRYDPDWAFGFAKRPYNWEFSTGVQHELITRMSVSASYFRRIYGNFDVTDNLSVGPADYDGYCVTAPADARLPGSGQQVCGLFDLKKEKVGQINRIGTGASKFGNQYEHWSGVDLTMNARLPKVVLQGGVAIGKQMTDNCDVLPKIDSPDARFCHIDYAFLTQVKFLGSYTLPWDVQVAATFQSIPGPQILASGTYTNAQIQPSLGRPLSSGSTATVSLVEPGTLYVERLNQVDLRFTKIFRAGIARFRGMVDLYNVFNDNTVLKQSDAYGATIGPATGSAWQVPQAIIPGRVVKFGVQVNF